MSQSGTDDPHSAAADAPPTSSDRPVSPPTSSDRPMSPSMLRPPPTHVEYNYEFSPGLFHRVPWEEEPPAQIHYAIRQYEKQYLKNISNSQFKSYMDAHHRSRFLALIFFSNRVEESGLRESDTYQLINKMFEDGTLGDYSDEKVREVAKSGKGSSLNKKSTDVRSRQEVIQHAQAYYYLCVQNIDKELTEELVLETHRILMRNISHENDPEKLVKAGEYRTVPSYAGMHTFIPPDAIRRCWDVALYNYRFYYKNTENEEGARDPYSLAAHMMYEFVTIHPFEDGNGRMCRLILNYVLLRYGVPFPVPMGFGSHKKAKHHYMQAIHKARKKNGHTGALATIILASVQHGWASFFETQRVLNETKKGTKIHATNESEM